MEYDPDTQRIRARLDNYATPAEIAEEAYRVCRKNAELRKEVCQHYCLECLRICLLTTCLRL